MAVQGNPRKPTGQYSFSGIAKIAKGPHDSQSFTLKTVGGPSGTTTADRPLANIHANVPNV